MAGEQLFVYLNAMSRQYQVSHARIWSEIKCPAISQPWLQQKVTKSKKNLQISEFLLHKGHVLSSLGFYIYRGGAKEQFCNWCINVSLLSNSNDNLSRTQNQKLPSSKSQSLRRLHWPTNQQTMQMVKHTCEKRVMWRGWLFWQKKLAENLA